MLPRILLLLASAFLGSFPLYATEAGMPSLGDRLNASMIWTAVAPPSERGYVHAVFRKTFDLDKQPSAAQLHLFAYTRYILYINGRYVGRGPSRFENKHPEYDTWDISPFLHGGKNVVAVLVHRDLPGGRVMQHAPGFTARLEIARDGQAPLVIASNASWRGFVEPAYLPQPASWTSFPEHMDARLSPGDWTAEDFDDSALPAAAPVTVTDPAVWPSLSPRTIPLLKEEAIPFTLDKVNVPVPTDKPFFLDTGEVLNIRTPRVVQAYYALDLEATAGARLEAVPFLPEGPGAEASTYICKGGHQRWIVSDTFAFTCVALRITDGTATILSVRVIERRYPFAIAGSFTSSDPLLDKIWKIAAHSLLLLSEDAYVDCADRERVEWMDCDPPAYDSTRAILAGPEINGKPAWSDARIYAELLRRMSLTQRDDGMLKAHTCSERWDIHAIMEDRTCGWVEGLRKYAEATGDDTLIRELWPACQKLLVWFQNHRAESGLVRAREWVVWDNPLLYTTSESAALNAFVYRAFADGAWLAARLGDTAAATKWTNLADSLKEAFNTHLWNEEIGAYDSAIGDPKILPADRATQRQFTMKVVDGRTEPTAHANLFALDRGLVPPDRHERVVAWTIAHSAELTSFMSDYFYAKLLYRTDTETNDQLALNKIRKDWKEMTDSPWQTTWEDSSGNSKAHVYGIGPAYLFSTYVLGVRRDEPVSEKRIIIEPHLGDLTHAEGTVCSEFGLTDVAWKREGDALLFSITVPPGVEAMVRLPIVKGLVPTIELNGRPLQTTSESSRTTFTLTSGSYTGRLLPAK